MTLRIGLLSVFLGLCCCCAMGQDHCEDFKKTLAGKDDNKPSTAAKVSRMNNLVVSLRSELGKRLGGDHTKVKNARGKLTDAEKCRDSLVKRRNFEGWSSFVGKAVLRKPGPDGKNEPVDIVGAQLLVWTKKDNQATGAGGFVATGLPTKGADVLDYVGAGFVFSGRFPDAGHQFNLGIGYMIDRKGYMIDRKGHKPNSKTGKPAGEGSMVRMDRSGVFISLSLNAVSSGFPIYRELSKAAKGSVDFTRATQ